MELEERRDVEAIRRADEIEDLSVEHRRSVVIGGEPGRRVQDELDAHERHLANPPAVQTAPSPSWEAPVAPVRSRRSAFLIAALLLIVAVGAALVLITSLSHRAAATPSEWSEG